MTKTRTPDRDRSAASEAAAALPQGSFGAWLRTQREARGVSVREIADSSKISVRYLEALEQDRFDVLPAPVFTRGFLREYARIVGLDPDEVVNLYLLASAEEEEEEAATSEEGPARDPGAPSPLLYALVLVVVVVVLLGIAALVSYWARSGTGVEADPAEVGSASAPAPAPAAPAPGAPDATAAARAAVPEASAGDSPLLLQLDFAEDCWVELVVDGGRRTGELRTSGEVVTIEAAEQILLTLGNPSGVRVEVDGRPLALPGDGERVVRDLRIDRRPPPGRDAPDPRS